MVPVIAALLFSHLAVFLGGLWLGYATKIKDSRTMCLDGKHAQ